jgi:hypothetical protein
MRSVAIGFLPVLKKTLTSRRDSVDQPQTRRKIADEPDVAFLVPARALKHDKSATTKSTPCLYWVNFDGPSRLCLPVHVRFGPIVLQNTAAFFI